MPQQIFCIVKVSIEDHNYTCKAGDLLYVTEPSPMDAELEPARILAIQEALAWGSELLLVRKNNKGEKQNVPYSDTVDYSADSRTGEDDAELWHGGEKHITQIRQNSAATEKKTSLVAEKNQLQNDMEALNKDIRVFDSKNEELRKMRTALHKRKERILEALKETPEQQQKYTIAKLG
jgi:hypothetical protein